MHAVAYKSPQRAKKEREGHFVMLWSPVTQYFFYFFSFLGNKAPAVFLSLAQQSEVPDW